MDLQKKIEIAKLGLHWTARLGASSIVTTIVYTHLQPETLIDKIKIGVGCVAVGGIVSNAAGDHMDEMFDEAHNAINVVLEKRRENQAARQSS
jgi:hypothetical protein